MVGFLRGFFKKRTNCQPVKINQNPFEYRFEKVIKWTQKLTFLNNVIKFLNRKNNRLAIPFLIFVFGGSLGLREFADLRYKYRNVAPVREELERTGVKLRDRKETTIEAAYEKLKEVDLDNWENKRIPRPWEEEEANQATASK
ncbi:cytochrome c oxidase assembly protein COX16 homolog, mitochondrial [Orussus abietinus]|uniref:cytochrome c oxidase assembly protein COX16 homolog, mitochondrial n=1 Tax=Orussus abietinus TaxID=222816 RepID=UPI00062653E0|nr:cytochrome c oxidase assembly protein COX16 homolog, mitochondrial [Orussus abietinus]XP_012272611.1 cytochrome c oxidase assembly protein COX16 homolog, mitochondrial [Orussus abietinus]